MAQRILICLILANAVLGLANPTEKIQTLAKSPAPLARKLGGHHQNHKMVQPNSAPEPSPSSSSSTAPQPEEGKDRSGSLDELAPVSVEEQETEKAHHHHHHHHSVDRSVAGGGVILGGLATSFLVVIFFYIRATGRHKGDMDTAATSLPTTSTSIITMFVLLLLYSNYTKS